jgi:lipid-A-disaccharide synthase
MNGVATGHATTDGTVTTRHSGSDRLHVFIVAGEASGDRLGASLMAAIAEQVGRQVDFAGIGGPDMVERGLASLFAFDDLAINGFTAIPARLPLILRRIRETADTIIAAHPDVLVIIDSPDFTHRVARRVRSAAPGIPIIDYVSPTVWAWRPRRAAAMRAYVDHVLALLPFESEAHRRLGGPPCTYVGHPLVEAVATLRPNAEDAARRATSPPVVLVLPGSRESEIGRHLPTFAAAVALACERLGAAEIVVPTLPPLGDRLERATRAWPVPPLFVVEPARKWAAFRQARAALAASGTVTLELALAGVPTVLAYKVALVEELIARAMIKVPMVGLANLILGEKIMPELLQREASPQKLARALIELIEDTPARRRQCAAFARLDAIMEVGSAAPSARAAAIVVEAARHRAPR